MKSFADLMRDYELSAAGPSVTGPREKAIAQADAMLRKLGALNSKDELNSKYSNQNWWSPKTKSGKRRITVRYDNRIVPELCTDVDDDLQSVKNVIEIFRKIIIDADQSLWDAEQHRRTTSEKS
jgi:hypothetical protein